MSDNGIIVSFRSLGISGVFHKPIRHQYHYDEIIDGLTNTVEGLEMEGTKQLGGKALLVDDEHICQHIGAMILKKIGVEVDIAESGKEALDKTAETYYDFILMDIQMPDLNGLQTTELIRSREKEAGAYPSVIIAVTANDKISMKEQCLAAGMNDLLIKPLQIEPLAKNLGLHKSVNTKNEHISPDGDPFSEQFVENVLDEQVIWDRALALRYLGGDEDLLIDLMQLFIDRKNKLLGALEDAMKTADGEAISCAAHAFKGAVNHFAAKRCQKLAFVIEIKAGRGWLDGLDSYFNELKIAVNTLEDELKQQLATNPG